MMRTKYLLIANRFLGESIPLLPLLSLYFSESGLSLSTIALIFATLAITVFTFEIPCGVLSDKIPFKYSLVTSRILKASAFLCFLFQPTFIGFMGGAFLWGISSALDSGAFQGYVYQFLKNTNQSQFFSRSYGHLMTSGMVGVLMAAGIATQVDTLGFHTLQIIGVVALGASVLVTLLLPPLTQNDVQSDANKKIWSDLVQLAMQIRYSRSLVLVLLIGVSAGAIKGTFDDFTPLLLADVGWNLATVGYAVFFVYILQSFGTLIGSYVAVHIRKQWLNLFVCGSGFILIGIIAMPLAVLFLLGIIIVIDGVLWVQNDTVLQNLAKDESRATLMSVKNFLTELLSFFVFGLIWFFGDLVSLPVMYTLAGGIMVFVAVLGFVFRADKSHPMRS